MSKPLRIAFYSYAFPPAVGGIESISLVLASEFARMGNEVRVLTQAPLNGSAEAAYDFEVFRHPSRGQLWDCVRWCDVYFQNNISLPALWPLLFLRKPWVVAHHTWVRSVNGDIDLAARLKLWIIRQATASISISQAIAEQFSTSQDLIGNCYDATLFRRSETISREKDLIFVGRLVSDKGVDTLLEALKILREKGKAFLLTIVGGGPEEMTLRAQAKAAGLTEQIQFAGIKHGAELVQLLQAHRIMVIPSRWEEPYGIVALEALACGCFVVGSEKGGLRDAIGPGGLLFPNGDAIALADSLQRAFLECETFPTAAVADHLAERSPQAVAKAYLDVLQRVAR